ncbi:ABC transporter permease [Paenibacillus gansuensis]|uniref:ABC transporter permease n=1 Tax=Paenibacillus gansuensis TaxID=306542 RepID=A0ABW5PJV0_9BACL
MVNLILNENMKLYRRWRTWTMMGLMIVVVILASFMDWYYDGKEAKGDGWKQQVQEDTRKYQKALADPDLDPETKAYFEEQVKLNSYRLDNDIRSEDGTMWDGINNSAELIVLITLFTVIVAGDSMAGEFTGGTIKLLLIRPASRLKILISKYLSMLMFGILLLVILFAVSVLFNGILYQFGHMNLPLLEIGAEGQVIEKNMVANLWESYLINCVSTVMFVTMAFMISSAFRSSALAIGLSIFALFAGALMMDLLQPYEWSKYLLFSNLGLSLGERPYQEGMTTTFSVLVLSAYFIVFNLTSWLVFTRRDVAA